MDEKEQKEQQEVVEDLMKDTGGLLAATLFGFCCCIPTLGLSWIPFCCIRKRTVKHLKKHGDKLEKIAERAASEEAKKQAEEAAKQAAEAEVKTEAPVAVPGTVDIPPSN